MSVGGGSASESARVRCLTLFPWNVMLENTIQGAGAEGPQESWC